MTNPRKRSDPRHQARFPRLKLKHMRWATLARLNRQPVRQPQQEQP